MQFIPIVERRGVGVHGEESPTDEGSTPAIESLISSRSVRPAQFGNFLTEAFDEWLKRDVGNIFVQIFDQALSAWTGIEPSLCVFRKQCGRAMAIEHNGDVYSCDHFVEPKYKLGNIHELPILDMANSEQQFEFGRDKETTLPNYCRECEVRFACNGECPKNRFIETPDGEAGLNYLCAGYRKFFNHIGPTMKLMAEELRHQRPAANVMHRLNAARRDGKSNAPTAARNSPKLVSPSTRRPISPGRNEPCPCGSGKKYKKCCQRG